MSEKPMSAEQNAHGNRPTANCTYERELKG